MSKLTEEVRARLEKATPAPWDWTPGERELSATGDEEYISPAFISPFQNGVDMDEYLGLKDEDAELIAHAPSDLAALIQQVEAAEKLALSLKEVMAMRQAVIDVGGAEGPLDLQVIAKFAEMQAGVTDRIVAALAHWEEVTQ